MFTDLKLSIQYISRNKFHIIILIALIAFLIDILYVNLFTNYFYYMPNIGNYPWLDALNYFNMSYVPFKPNVAESPFIYRILTPYLVYLIPLNHLIGFKILNYSSIILTSIIFYFYLKKLNFSHFVSILGMLFFLFSPISIYYIFNYCLTDPLTFLFFLLAFYGILTKNKKLYFVALTIGILNRETILFTIPLYFIRELREENIKESLKSTFLISLPSLALFSGIRYIINYSSYYSTYSIGLIKNMLIGNIIKIGYPILYQSYMSFGILWIAFFLIIIKNKIKNDFLKDTIWLLPLMAIQIFFAMDIFRITQLAFPIIIPIALYFFAEKPSIKYYLPLIGICLISILLTIKYWYIFRLGTTGNIVLEIYTISLLIIILYYFKFRKNISNEEKIRNYLHK